MRQKRRDSDTPVKKSQPSSTVLTASKGAIDSGLASLFASSSGPVKISRIPASSAKKPVDVREKETARENKGVSKESDIEYGSDKPTAKEKSDFRGLRNGVTTGGDGNEIERSRKRRRIHQVDDLESSYMNRLAEEEEKEELRRRAVQQADNGRPQQHKEEHFDNVMLEQDESSTSLELGDLTVPHHEAIAGLDTSATLSKVARTVFLSNVSTAAIKSKSAKKALLSHLASSLHALKERDPPLKVESLRFRSTAFASGVGPKKAAFAKKELMDDTTASTNAYVVYSSEAAARLAASRLNGSIVLDRHLRADYAAQPAVIDHRRCVFVGNLNFVDKENMENVDADEHRKLRRPKAREPADAEEGLWRVFNRAGTVESVRVVRERETRVGKGFAYVQFKDENGVEAALLYNDKRFPPMLPRKLRVVRAKRQRQAGTKHGSYAHGGNMKTKNTTDKFGSRNNRASVNARPLGEGRLGGRNRSSGFIFEGHRASISGGGKPASFRPKKRRVIKPSTRSSRRGSAFKAAGGKRKRDG